MINENDLFYDDNELVPSKKGEYYDIYRKNSL